MPSKGNMPVPQKWSGQDKRFGETVKNNLDVLCGFSGDPLDRALTARDLLDSGIVKLTAGSRSFSGSSTGLAPIVTGETYGVPPAPTNLEANGAFQTINLSWELSDYFGRSYVEVHRHTSDVIADATLVGQASGLAGLFSDPVGGGQTYYYWVRAVNQNGVAGPFNSSTGTRGQTAPDVTFLLETLEDAVTSSQLATDLTTKLEGYDDDIAALETTYGSTVSAATSAAAAAASESAAIAAKTAALLAQSNAETAEDNAELAETNAETAQSGAETAQAAASQSATGAAGSASSASQSATTSANSATAAGSSAAAAATSETNAETYATNAGTASTASQTSKLAAEAAETNAATSATAAATSATNASASQTAAAQSASAANTSKLAAETAEGNAETSETNAASSETNASGSASSASTSATNAANSATAAGNSASAANTSAGTAATKATDAGTSAAAALVSKTAASTSATNSANSASAAATSATNASASETAAGQSATTATTQANTATTKAADASTFASNAATSATAADGSATAAASTVNGLTARLDNAGGTGVTVEQQFTANAGALGTLEGQYTVKVDANGAVAGFGLANTTTSSGNNTSEFYVNADRFAIMRGGSDTTAAVAPFIVQTTATMVNGVYVPAGVYMDTAFIKNASIVAAQIGSVNADTINAGTLDVTSLITTNAIEASKLLLDSTSLEETTLSDGTKALSVKAVSASKIEAGTIDATNVTISNLWAENISGDISKVVPFTLGQSYVDIGYNNIIWSGTIPAPSTVNGITSPKRPFVNATGWGNFENDDAYRVMLKMRVNSGSSTVSLGNLMAKSTQGQHIGNGVVIYNYFAEFSGDKRSSIPNGAELQQSSTTKGYAINNAYSSSTNRTIVQYTPVSGQAFSVGTATNSAYSPTFTEVAFNYFRSPQDYHGHAFNITGGLGSATTHSVDVEIRMMRYAPNYQGVPYTLRTNDKTNDRVYGLYGTMMSLR